MGVNEVNAAFQGRLTTEAPHQDSFHDPLLPRGGGLGGGDQINLHSLHKASCSLWGSSQIDLAPRSSTY